MTDCSLCSPSAVKLPAQLHLPVLLYSANATGNQTTAVLPSNWRQYALFTEQYHPVSRSSCLRSALRELAPETDGFANPLHANFGMPPQIKPRLVPSTHSLTKSTPWSWGLLEKHPVAHPRTSQHSMEPEVHYRVHKSLPLVAKIQKNKSLSPRSLVAFRKKNYGEFLAQRPTPKLEDHSIHS
jgi:hypothetical protein